MKYIYIFAVLAHSPCRFWDVPSKLAEYLLLNYILNPSSSFFLSLVISLLLKLLAGPRLRSSQQGQQDLLAIGSFSVSWVPSFSFQIFCSLLIFLTALFLHINMSLFVCRTREATRCWILGVPVLNILYSLRDFWQHSRGHLLYRD